LDGVTTTDPVIANGRPYTVRVRLGDETRQSVDTIENTVFNSATGKLATLGSLAQVTQLPPQNEIRRENLQRMVVVTAQLQGSDLGTAIVKVQRRVNAMHLPPTVHVVYGGSYQEQQKSFSELLQVLLISLSLVFGVLLVEFRNFSAPIAILTSSILSVGGVVFALLVTGITFNVASFMGVIMVIGIVAKNGILLLDADERLSPRRGFRQGCDAARRTTPPSAHCDDSDGSHLRDAPTGLRARRWLSMLQPLAIAVIGGLVISMVLSLIVTPVIYYLLTSRRHDPLREEVTAS
jgi:multidrug efflux pump subunit AcrB